MRFRESFSALAAAVSRVGPALIGVALIGVALAGVALAGAALAETPALSGVSGNSSAKPAIGLAAPLISYTDSELEQGLALAIAAHPAWQTLIADGKLGICVADLGRAERAPRFAQANGGHMMYAASLPKIAVLLGAYASFEDGTLPETDLAHAKLGDMIRVSSNEAATFIIEAVGFDRLEQILRDPRFRFYDEASGGGLWVGKAYGGNGTRRGDPLFNISHGATATQVCRFYYQLAAGRLISPERSAQMLEDLSGTALGHKFMAYLNEQAPAAEVYRKSGTWRDFHADSVLVRDSAWRNYVLVGLVEDADGDALLRELIAIVDRLLEP